MSASSSSSHDRHRPLSVAYARMFFGGPNSASWLAEVDIGPAVNLTSSLGQVPKFQQRP